MNAKKTGEKGAIDLSLGFIITVVFAVVLLSLAIFWLRGFFVQLEPLTVDLTQQAQSEIAKVFQNTDKNFAVWPSKYTIMPGKKLIMAAGIRNNDKEGRNLYYVVNMKITATDASIQLSSVDGWILVPGNATRVPAAGTANRDIALNVPSDAPQGNYLFDVYSCYGTSTTEAGRPADCSIDSMNLWGSPQPVTITIQS
jgi:hypothetical protein